MKWLPFPGPFFRAFFLFSLPRPSALLIAQPPNSTRTTNGLSRKTSSCYSIRSTRPVTPPLEVSDARRHCGRPDDAPTRLQPSGCCTSSMPCLSHARDCVLAPQVDCVLSSARLSPLASAQHSATHRLAPLSLLAASAAMSAADADGKRRKADALTTVRSEGRRTVMLHG